jgi:hypothetical protein
MRVLENGYIMSHQEMSQVAQIIKTLKADADRYRWLNKSTAQLFMVTEEQMDNEIDRAMNGRAK